MGTLWFTEPLGNTAASELFQHAGTPFKSQSVLTWLVFQRSPGPPFQVSVASGDSISRLSARSNRSLRLGPGR